MKAQIDEGYVLIASGAQKYFDLALDCCLSLKRFDPSRPVQLLLGAGDFNFERGLSDFAFVDELSVDANLGATLDKFRLFELSRFERSMYVDADCLLMKAGIDTHWSRLRDYSFAIPGQKTSTGEWYGTDLQALCKKLELPFVVKINSGVIYFAKDEVAQKTFEDAKQSYFLHSGEILQKHGAGLHGDEPFFAISMAKNELQVYPPICPDEISLMFSTIDARDFEMNAIEGVCSFTKGTVRVSPHIAHFVGLRPQELYESLRSEFRHLNSQARS